jgi:uncharacterized RDD family membrane protein YckC
MEMPDFTKYSLSELYDSLSHIDKIQYPDRVKIIEELIVIKGGDKDIYTQPVSNQSEPRSHLNNRKVKDKEISIVEVTAPEGEIIQQILATRGLRLGGLLLDLVFMMIPLFIIILLFFSPSGLPDFKNLSLNQHLLLIFIGQVIFLGLNGYYLWTKGQTLGKKVVGTRIVNMSGNTPPFLILYVARYVSLIFIGYIPILGTIFSILNPLFIFRKDHRCIHDHIAGTRVIMA